MRNVVKDAEKQRAAMAAQEAEARRRQQEREDEEAARLIAHAKHSKLFTLNWTDGSHPSVQCFDNTEQWKAFISGDAKDKLMNPYVIKGAAVAGARLSDRMRQWCTAFESHCTSKSKDTVYAPLGDIGKAEFNELVEKLGFTDLQSKTLIPSIKRQMTDIDLYGYTQTSLYCDWPAGYLGSIWFHFGGKMSLLLMEATDLAKVCPKNGSEPTTWSTLREWALQLDSQKVNKEYMVELKTKGLTVWHINLISGDVLFVPPGHLLLGAPLDGAAHGIQRPFVGKGAKVGMMMSKGLDFFAESESKLKQAVAASVDALLMEEDP